MSYLGNKPADSYLQLKTQQITGTGTDTYTLDYPVSSASDLRVIVNNVPQNVNSYTASNTTLTLGGTISASDECWVHFLGRSVGSIAPATGSVTNAMLAGSIATSKLADGSTFATTNGITEMDSWRITADVTGQTVPLTANWERVDTYDWTKFGTGLTESSGVFTFPSTGYWLILARQHIYNPSTSSYQCGLRLEWTNDNFSSANYPMEPPSHGTAGYAQTHTMAYVFDVTNTTNNKFRFSFTTSHASSVLIGNTSSTRTGFTIMRIGDT